MIPLPLAWILLIVMQQTSGSSPILQQETLKFLYPPILSTQAIECDCHTIFCHRVYWFYSNLKQSKVQYLGICNNADRYSHGDGVDEKRFEMRKKSSASFTLRISNVTEADTGIYSCVLQDPKNNEMWKPGVLLLPGISPTSTPKTKPKPPVESDCCPENAEQDSDVCGSLILWALVGLIATLALALLCILYYFSRLPKKCQHRFVKKR